MTYTYDYSKGEGTRKQVLVAQRIERKGPDSLIDLLIAQKLNIYDREQRMNLLKEQTDADWKALEAELQSSDEEIADLQENMAWWNWNDKDTYLSLTTKYKNIYLEG